jgi:hypothetical protein
VITCRIRGQFHEIRPGSAGSTCREVAGMNIAVKVRINTKAVIL